MSTVDGVGDPGGMESSDVVPPIFFSDIDIDAVSRANLAYLPPPHRHWIQPTRCVAMDCDGPKKVLIHDLDGSLTGLGADASIVARAEWMHQVWIYICAPGVHVYVDAPDVDRLPSNRHPP